MIEGPYVPKPSFWSGFKWGTLCGMFLMFFAFHFGIWVEDSHLFKDWKPVSYGKMFGWLKGTSGQLQGETK